MIKNLVFDVGNVLIKGKCSSILSKFSCSEQEREVIENTFMTNYSELDLGNMTISEYVDSCNMPEDIMNKFGDILRKYYIYRDFNVDLLNLLPKFKQNGYKIYYLSDNNREAFDYWLSIPEFNQADGMVVSCDYKCVKASQKLFDVFLEKYYLNPKECLFIDDRSINIQIAKELGFNCILYGADKDSFDSLIECLKKQGVKL